MTFRNSMTEDTEISIETFENSSRYTILKHPSSFSKEITLKIWLKEN